MGFLIIMRSLVVDRFSRFYAEPNIWPSILDVSRFRDGICINFDEIRGNGCCGKSATLLLHIAGILPTSQADGYAIVI